MALKCAISRLDWPQYNRDLALISWHAESVGRLAARRRRQREAEALELREAPVVLLLRALELLLPVIEAVLAVSFSLALFLALSY